MAASKIRCHKTNHIDSLYTSRFQYQRLVLDTQFISQIFLGHRSHERRTTNFLDIPSHPAAHATTPYIHKFDLTISVLHPPGSQPVIYAQGASGAERSNTPLRTSRFGGITDISIQGSGIGAVGENLSASAKHNESAY